ncbi:hypothetical protein [Motiliproteus sp. SC1-56]|uniref:hypothetical protein n=1 Tax=Motiliproteus sp. SC1-56 TaxID=2799565 RepID=UPI001A8EDA7F|nr:hypothetical protein [Motiliproteus sp. SC1-56]
MSAHDMGSWTIALTYLATSAYLIYELRPNKALSILACFTTAMLACFVGLLFTGLTTHALAQLQVPLSNEILLGVLVAFGTGLAMLVRHLWNRSR